MHGDHDISQEGGLRPSAGKKRPGRPEKYRQRKGGDEGNELQVVWAEERVTGRSPREGNAPHGLGESSQVMKGTSPFADAVISAAMGGRRLGVLPVGPFSRGSIHLKNTPYWFGNQGKRLHQAEEKSNQPLTPGSVSSRGNKTEKKNAMWRRTPGTGSTSIRNDVDLWRFSTLGG